MMRVYNQNLLNDWHRFIITTALGVGELENRRVSERHVIVQNLYR